MPLLACAHKVRQLALKGMLTARRRQDFCSRPESKVTPRGYQEGNIARKYGKVDCKNMPVCSSSTLLQMLCATDAVCTEGNT